MNNLKPIIFLVTIISIAFAFGMKTNAASLVGVENGKVYTSQFTSGNNELTKEFSVSGKGKLTLNIVRPVESDGFMSSFTVSLYNSKGKEVKNEYFYSSSNSGNPKESLNIYLAKGSYTIKFQTNIYDSQPVSWSYMFDFDSSWKLQTPKITQTKKKDGITYYAYIDLVNHGYEGVEGYLKTDDGKWEKEYSGTSDPSKEILKYYFRYYNTATFYFYKFRGYVTLTDGTKVYSSFSNVLYTKTNYKPAAPTVFAISPKTKKVKLSWTSVKKAKGYVIYRSTKKSKGYKKIKTTSKTTYINSKLKKGKTYYYKVKTYRVVNKVKLYSKYSSVAKVTVK